MSDTNAAPIELWSWPTPNGHKVHIMLEELGLPYTPIPVDIGAGRQFRSDFLAITPNHRIPAIVDPNGPGGTPFSLFESGAILIYLADKSGRMLPDGQTLEWMFFQAAHVGPTLGQLGYFKVFAEEKVPAAIDRFQIECERVLGVLDTRLGRAPHLGGTAFGLADVMTYPWIATARERLGFDFSSMPNLARWTDAVGARPAVVKGMAVPQVA